MLKLCVVMSPLLHCAAVFEPPRRFTPPTPPHPPTEPWLHMGLALAGAYLGSRLGALYEDVGATKDRQAAAFTALPSWAYAQLSPQQLDAELRDQRLAALRVKFAELAAEEEAQLKEALAAGGGGQQLS